MSGHTTICCAGEAMIELAPAGEPGLYAQNIAGDTLNTAVYLARAGMCVQYLSAVGDDAFSGKILGFLAAEGIDASSVRRVPGRQPGLYVISNTDSGEREFSYWRDSSPARQLFDRLPPLPAADVFYFSGITLAVCRSGFDNLQTYLRALRARGCRVVFDPNVRARLWHSLDEAREHYLAVVPLCDVVLPTLEDETLLWQVATVEQCCAFYSRFKLDELIIKTPALSAWGVSAGGDVEEVQAPAVQAVDTTGAGDAFAAGYLAARLQGASLVASMTAAQQLAAQVVQHRGAIMTRGSRLTGAAPSGRG